MTRWRALDGDNLRNFQCKHTKIECKTKTNLLLKMNYNKNPNIDSLIIYYIPLLKTNYNRNPNIDSLIICYVPLLKMNYNKNPNIESIIICYVPLLLRSNSKQGDNNFADTCQCTLTYIIR